MRDRWLASASWAMLAGALSSGCFSSSSAEPSGEGPEDAETQTVMDATNVQDAAGPVQDPTVAIEAAAEAGSPEAAPEAAVEAGPAPVTVTVVDHLGPESGVYIVFQDVNGNVLSTATTNGAGQVTQLLGEATQVTALTGSTPVQEETFAVRHAVTDGGDSADAGVEVIPSPSNVSLVTVQGVSPGDNLSLVDPSDTTYSNAIVTIEALPDGGPAATQSYLVHVGGCPTYGTGSTSELPYEVSLTSDCESNGTFPVLVIAQGGPDAGNALLGYTWQDGNTIPLDGGMAHVVMTGPWETDLTNQTLVAENLPSSAAPYGSYSEIASNVATPTTVSFSPDAGFLAFAGHPGFAAAVQSEVGASLGNNGIYSTTAIATRGPFVGDSGTTIDFSTALPLITWVNQDAGFPTSDAAIPPSAQPSASWGTDAGSLASVSGVVVQFSWYNYGDGAGGQTYGTWTVVAAPTATSVTAPALPPELAEWGLGPNASLYPTPIVIAVQSASLPTYTAFRSQFAALPVTAAFSNQTNGPIIPALPAAGTLKLTAVTANSD